MSRKITIDFTCPECQHTGQTDVYQSVNVTEEPEFKDKVLNFDLFLFSCPQCGAKLDRTNPMLYHDMKRKLMIQLHPLSDQPLWWKLVEHDKAAFDRGMSQLEGNEAVENTIFRSCFGPLELREKILIFDKDQDDRIVELMKIRFLSQQLKKIAENPLSVYFVDLLDNGDMLLLAINDNNGEETDQIRVPADLLTANYDELMHNDDVAYILAEPYVNVKKLFFPPEAKH